MLQYFFFFSRLKEKEQKKQEGLFIEFNLTSSAPIFLFFICFFWREITIQQLPAIGVQVVHFRSCGARLSCFPGLKSPNLVWAPPKAQVHQRWRLLSPPVGSTRFGPCFGPFLTSIRTVLLTSFYFWYYFIFLFFSLFQFCFEVYTWFLYEVILYLLLCPIIWYILCL